jgi:DNA/RNA endonuclease YhcR with UshA esterase domain
VKGMPLILLILLCNTSVFSQITIELENVSKHIGDRVTVCGKVRGGRYLEQVKGNPTFLNMGAAFPKHTLTVVIWNDVRKEFEKAPEELFKDKEICVTGRVELYKGKVQIVVRGREDVNSKVSKNK